MKLYELLLEDRFGLPIDEILEGGVNSIKEEAESAGWPEGYTIKFCRNTQRQFNGSLIYRFEVFGRKQLMDLYAAADYPVGMRNTQGPMAIASLEVCKLRFHA